jgi:hypothetical protein
MANTYTYSGPGTRWAEGDPTSEDKLNIARINLDHVYEALNTIMDTDAADGVVTGTVSGAVTLTGSTNNQLTTVTGAGAIAGEANLTFDGTTMNVVGNAGVGIARTDGTLHVHTASAGTATATGGADDLVVENSTDVGLQFLSPNTAIASISFGDPESVTVGQIRYDHSANSMLFDVNGDNRMGIYSSGLVAIGDTANANMTVGLTINQSGNDNEILAFKSSDVAHGITGTGTETDTFGKFSKQAASGGLLMQGYSDATEGLNVWGIITTETTTDTSASVGAIGLSARLKSGTSWTTLGATGNAFYVSNLGTTVMLIKGNGDMHITNTTLAALDGEDDVGLVRAFQRSASDGLGMAMTEWDQQITSNEEDLKRVGVISSEGDFVIQQRMNSLLGGSVWQLHVAQKEMQRVYEAEIAELKRQLNLLMERN